MLKRKWLMLGVTIVLLGFIVACNSFDTEEDAGEKQEQVSLQFAYGWGEDAFNMHYKEPVEEALPHITLEMVDANVGHAEQVEELVAKGQIPDMWVGSGAAQLRILQRYELDYALDELFEKNNYDWAD